MEASYHGGGALAAFFPLLRVMLLLEKIALSKPKVKFDEQSPWPRYTTNI